MVMLEARLTREQPASLPPPCPDGGQEEGHIRGGPTARRGSSGSSGLSSCVSAAAAGPVVLALQAQHLLRQAPHPAPPARPAQSCDCFWQPRVQGQGPSVQQGWTSAVT